MDKTISISLARLTDGQLNVAPAESVRATKRPEHYRRLGAVEGLPPVKCIHDTDGRYHVYGGLHTLVGVLMTGGKEIVAIVHDGTELDAYALSLQQNQNHGLQRSREDEDTVLWTAFEKFPSWSIDRVASWCGIDRERVQRVHAKLVADGTLSLESPSEVTGIDDANLREVSAAVDMQSAERATDRVIRSVDAGKVDEVTAMTRLWLMKRSGDWPESLRSSTRSGNTPVAGTRRRRSSNGCSPRSMKSMKLSELDGRRR